MGLEGSAHGELESHRKEQPPSPVVRVKVAADESAFLRRFQGLASELGVAIQASFLRASPRGGTMTSTSIFSTFPSLDSANAVFTRVFSITRFDVFVLICVLLALLCPKWERQARRRTLWHCTTGMVIASSCTQSCTPRCGRSARACAATSSFCTIHVFRIFQRYNHPTRYDHPTRVVAHSTSCDGGWALIDACDPML